MQLIEIGVGSRGIAVNAVVYFDSIRIRLQPVQIGEASVFDNDRIAEYLSDGEAAPGYAESGLRVELEPDFDTAVRTNSHR